MNVLPKGECEYCKENVKYQEEATEAAASSCAVAIAVAIAGVFHSRFREYVGDDQLYMND